MSVFSPKLLCVSGMACALLWSLVTNQPSEAIVPTLSGNGLADESRPLRSSRLTDVSTAGDPIPKWPDRRMETFVSTEASESDASRLKLTTQRVVVFKDGYCLVVKEGLATTDAAGCVYTDEVPDSAVLGSFWAVPTSGKIRSLVAGWVHSETQSKIETDCSNLAEIIASNLGRPCSFTIGSQAYRGTISKMLHHRDAKTSHEELLRANDGRLHSRPGVAVTEVQETISVAPTAATFFILSTGAGEVVLPISSVQNLTIDGMQSTIEQTVHRKSTHKRITIDTGTPDKPVKMNLMYFRPDVRWIPTYRIDLTDELAERQTQSVADKTEKIAEIFMQGELLNEAEDFVDVPFHLVVGVPNFRFRNTPSPMVLESTMRNALAQAAPQIMGNQSQLSNAMFTQRASEYGGGRQRSINAATANVDIPEELTSSGGNDLFVYKLGAMSLAKGERATMPILRTEVPYRDVYTWDVELPHAETYAAGGTSTTSPLLLTENKVWRQIELVNNTEMPWTTGAAMFVDGIQPLAQELLTYTSPGSVCRVPVTIAIDLKGRAEDAETGRELQKLVWRGSHYARVSGEIKLDLENQKQTDVDAEINLRFGGEAEESSDDGKIVLRPFHAEDWYNQKGDAINNSSQVKWRTKILPGECFQPNVQYAFWLRY
ncbi:hypothetical protein [Allorhodopirellula solitaria]|uniref:Uncharacterized protein n=1 Tax=Allorhodopirellula solitaria TaxID=2527987 RepID=A0A5C5XY25_9BACT|nr:hypothetical protein [Allorhodopirellula solitaria]TWT67421.1 hypothetical protein CA85_22720 [Allorhodopirellula solitaria]